MSAADRPQRIALLCTRGRVRVIVCSLCGALVLATAQDRHDAVHRADVRRAE